MFKHHFDHPLDKKTIFHWFLLSFNGGCINAGGFLATGRFVSHVTGFATLFGVEMSKEQVNMALSLLSVPLFFLLGAFIAGLLIDRPLHKGRQPHFDWVMGLSAFFLFLSATGGNLLKLGSFGNITGARESYSLMMFLCLASGLQNGAITSSSARSVRTTHLTGLTTDLGLGLARIFTFGLKTNFLQKEMRANYLRIGSILSFVFGSAVGAWFFFHLGYKGFIISGIISAYAAWQGKKTKRTPRSHEEPVNNSNSIA